MLRNLAAAAAQNVNTATFCSHRLPHIVYTCNTAAVDHLFASKHKHRHANSQYHLHTHTHTTTVGSVRPLQLPSQTPPQQLIKECSCSSSSQVCHTCPSLFHHPLRLKSATWRAT